MNAFYKKILFTCLIVMNAAFAFSQGTRDNSTSNYQQVNTYINSVLPAITQILSLAR